MAGLNIRQRKFCRAYLKTKCDANQALNAAGYKSTNSYKARFQVYKLFKNPEVKEYYNGLLKKMEDKEGLTVGFLYKTLREMIDVCVPAFHEDLATPEQKQARASWISENVSGCVKVISEINKMQGNYAPAKTEATNLNVNTDAEVEDIERIFADLCKQNEKQF